MLSSSASAVGAYTWQIVTAPVAVLNLADRILSFNQSVTHQCSLRQFGQDQSYSCSMFILSSRIDDLVSLYPVFLCPSPMCFSQSNDIPSQPFQLFHQYSRCSRPNVPCSQSGNSLGRNDITFRT